MLKSWLREYLMAHVYFVAFSAIVSASIIVIIKLFQLLEVVAKLADGL